MLRVISEIRPAFVVAENVRGAVNLALDTVYAGLVGEGYKVYPYVIPASAVGAPHQRERLFVFGVRSDVADAYAERLQGSERAGAFCGGAEATHELASERCEGSLWPTPRAGKASDEKLDSWLARRERGEVATPPLSLAVKMWPTPSASSATIQDMEQAKFSGNDPNRPKYSDVKSVGSLNPAWVECLMNFPLGWTDPDCDEPEPWPGWPAMMGERLWGTHTATVACRSNRFLENADKAMTPVEFVQKGESCYQYPYEPPRTVTGCPNRAKRLKCLGNAVVPAQARPFFEAMASIYSHTSYSGQYGNVPRETLRKGME